MNSESLRTAVHQIGGALTFPRTRQLVPRLLARRGVRVLLWWIVAFLVIGPYALLRGTMDDVGMPVHGAGLEEGLFGSLPTLWLQQHIFTLWPGPLEWASVVIHASWFFVPGLASLLVTWKRPDRIGSFFRWWIALQLIALPLFALFPLQPPWMANEEVTRIIALRFGGEIDDPNMLAAMPSLHVAVPLMIALWFLRERWRTPALLMLGYAALISFEVVFTGEHYVVDILGAVVVAFAVAWVASLDYRALVGRIPRWRPRAAMPVRRPRLQPALATAVRLHHRDRAQALIEFAFILPIMLVFLFAIVDFGIAIDRRITLQHSVREGARYAAVHADELDIKQKTVDQAQGIIGLADVDVCYIDGDDSNTSVGDPGDGVRIGGSLTWDFPIMKEIFSAFGVPPLSVDLTPSATARLERSVTGAIACS